MKTVKSLLLGSAAAIVGTAAVQAADLRAAAPVEFVRVCDAQGAGFFFIPGTDICMKIGGQLHAGVFVKTPNIGGATAATTGTFVPSTQTGHVALRALPFIGVAGIDSGMGVSTNDVTHFFGHARLNFDTRQRTDFGILRTFTEIAGDNGTLGNSGAVVGVTAFQLRHAIVQISNPIGVFTGGVTNSFFFDLGTGITTGGSGAGWELPLGARVSRVALFAYSANLGNGLTATVALEDRNFTDVGQFAGGAAGNAAFSAPGALVTASSVLPDLVGNLTWTGGGNSLALQGVIVRNAAHHTSTGRLMTSTGWGLAVSGVLNADFISRGSRAFARVVYTSGATNYAGTGLTQSAWGYAPNTVGSSNVGSLNNIGVLAAHVGYAHQWTAQWRSTIRASYAFNQLGAGIADTGPGGFFGNTQNIAGFVGNGIPASGQGSTATNTARTMWSVNGAVLWTPVNGFTAGLEVGVLGASFYGHTASGVATGLGAHRTGYYALFSVNRTW